MIYDNDVETCLYKTIVNVTYIYNEYVKDSPSSSLRHGYGATLELELCCYLRDEHLQAEGFDTLE